MGNDPKPSTDLWFPGQKKEEPANKFGGNLQDKKESSSNNIEETYDDDFEQSDLEFSKPKPTEKEPAFQKQKTPSKSDSIEDQVSGFEDKYDEDEDFF